MQQLQHKQFSVWNESTSLPRGYCDVPAGKGFAPDSYRDGESKYNKIRLRFKRYEA